MSIIVWTVLVTVALLLPVWVLYKRRNFLTLLLTYTPLPLYVVYDITGKCNANHYSEACTWGYVSYVFAFFAGGLLYLLITLVQLGICKIKHRK